MTFRPMAVIRKFCETTAIGSGAPQWKSPPAPVLLKRAAGLATASKAPNKEKVGKVTRDQVLEIVKIKKNDMACKSTNAAVRTIAGTARSMGIEVEGA